MDVLVQKICNIYVFPSCSRIIIRSNSSSRNTFEDAVLAPLEKSSAIPLSTPICPSSDHEQPGKDDFAYLWRPNYDQPVVQLISLALSLWLDLNLSHDLS